jgi:hypothetical protein
MENGRHDFIIQLNSLGLNVGTVLHELAHIDRKGELVEGHPDRFRKGLELYTGMFKKLFPVPDMVADAMETGADWPESVFPQKTIGAECQSQKFPEDLVEALCNILLGERIPLDIINSETGEVIIPANYKITKTYLRIMAAHVDHVEMCPSPIRIKIMSVIDAFRR